MGQKNLTRLLLLPMGPRHLAVVDDTADLHPVGKKQYCGYVLTSDKGVSKVGSHRWVCCCRHHAVVVPTPTRSHLKVFYVNTVAPAHPLLGHRRMSCGAVLLHNAYSGTWLPMQEYSSMTAFRRALINITDTHTHTRRVPLCTTISPTHTRRVPNVLQNTRHKNNVLAPRDESSQLCRVGDSVENDTVCSSRVRDLVRATVPGFTAVYWVIAPCHARLRWERCGIRTFRRRSSSMISWLFANPC